MNLSCPLCNDDKYEIVYNRMNDDASMQIVKCHSCKHYYTLLKKTVETNGLYNDEVYKVVENRESIFDKILTLEYTKVLNKINSLQNDKEYLLDFGSGKGKFASLAQKQGWKTKCVETSPERALYSIKAYGLDVNTEFYSSGTIFNLNFQTITLFHVLEHLPEPMPLLQQLLESNLEKNGIIVIEVPNFDSLQSVLAKKKWLHLDVPRHLSHFTPQRLEQFFSDLGYYPVRKSFFSLHLGVLGMLDSLMKIFGYRKNIIYQLKNKRSFPLLLRIFVLLPFALLLEAIASITGRGGIVRLYLKKKK